jgi:hypothetical protein
MDNKKEKDISDITQQFNRHAGKLFKIIDKNAGEENANAAWVVRIFKIMRNENPLCILEKCVEKLWDNKDAIISKDVKFFESCNLDKYIKKDKNKVWLDELVSLIRAKYFVLSEKEKDVMWEATNEMLKCVIQYKLVNGDFKE